MKGEKSKEGMKKIRVLKRSILSLLLCLSLVISPLAGTGLVVSADEDGGGIPAAQADNVVYLEENFDSLEAAQKFIASNGYNKGATPIDPPENVTKGLLTFKAGQRTNSSSIECNASIVDDNGNKYLDINEDGNATASRGIAFLFNYQESNKPPTVDELKSSGGMLQFSMDITTTGAFNILNFATTAADKTYVTYTGGKIPAIPAAEDGSKRHFWAVIDGANQKQYVIVTEADGTLVSSTIEDLTATGFDEVNFYTGNTKAQIDNIKVETAADVGLFTVSVKDGAKALEGAKVVIGAVEQTTDAAGNAVFALPYGNYTVKVSKDGYQASDGAATASESITMSADSSSKEVALSAMSYTAEPKAVTVEGGQSFIAASKEDTPAQSAAFTVSVKDQMGAAMGSGDYQVTWSILPEGKTEADPNVTIDEDGKVSVTKDFYADDKVAAFEVTATAATNGESAVGKATILIANSSVVYYEPIEWAIAAGVRNESKTLGAPVALPENATITLDIEYKAAPETQSTIALLSGSNKVTGVQYLKDGLTLKAWTGWTGNANMNQSGDVGKYTSGGKLAQNVTSAKVVFNIDTKNKTVVVSCGETKTNQMSFTMDFTTLSGLQWGLYRDYGDTTVHSILVEESEAAPLPSGTEYYVTENVSGNETTVDCSALVGTNVTKYRVTTSTGGRLVSQTFVDPAASLTVDTTGADKVEITPVFYYNIGAPGHKGEAGYDISMPAGSYDFRIVNTSGERCDVYADDQMLVNNILQYGSTPNYFDVKDVVISNNTTKISTADYSSKGSAAAMKIELYMVPSSKIVDRVRKVYVLGDSLVAKYYNGAEKDNNDITGWGQVLADYLTDDVEVIDLANSGVRAVALAETAFTQVNASAQAGDIFILESGYNDKTDNDQPATEAALKSMVDQALAKNVHVVMVSPNASWHDYDDPVAWSDVMEDVAKSYGDRVQFIDLSELSAAFLHTTYGTKENFESTCRLDYNIVRESENGLHSTYNGANKWASLVAGELYKIDATKSIVNEDYVYAFSDSKGNVISCSATGKLAEGYVKVTYSANGKGTDTYKTVKTGSKLTAPADPSASGFVFVGWCREADGTIAWNFDTDTVSADITLYAKWKELAAGTIYTQDFSKVTDAKTVATSTNAQPQLVIKEDAAHGKYLAYDFSSTDTNSRGAYMDFTGVDVSGKEKYIVEFDAAVKPGNEKATYLTVKGTDLEYLKDTHGKRNINEGADTGYLLKLTNGSTGTKYNVNDIPGKDVTIPSGEWCHYKLYVDKTQKMVTITITGSETGSIADKMVSAYSGEGNVAGLYMVAGRKFSVMAVDNILVREVNESVDEFGKIEVETLADAEFTAQLNTVITQPAEDAPVHKAITVKAKGSLGGDLTDKVSVAWSVVGLEKEDGYISLTQAPGTDSGTGGEKADTAAYTGTTAYFNVRNGVSNYYGYVQAVVTYGENSVTIITPFAVTGASAGDKNQLAPAVGYPVNMNDYADSLVGYEGTSNLINSRDLVLNNWSVYGSNGKRSLKLVKDADGTKSLEFASNGGGGSTVAVYQWSDQSDQYVIDFTAKFTNDTAFGVYFNTPNNSNSYPEWTASYSGGALKFGSDSINMSANEWYRFVVSADPSIQKASIAVYKGDTKVGEIEDVDMTNNDQVQKYFCFSGTWPMYLNSFKAYKPVTGTVTVGSGSDVAKVPEAGEAESTVDLSAVVTSTEGVKMTGAVQWSLAEEYANIEIEPKGAQTATLKISAGAAPGTVTVIASKDGKRAETEVMLTTSSNVVAFSKSTSSITIPFTGEQAVTATFAAETRDKDGKPIEGGAITYKLLAKDGVTETTVKGVTFKDGVLTVAPDASPAVVYVKASNAEGLSNRIKVNIHGLSFAFGSQDAEEGYTQVTDTLWNDRLGYGFADISGLTAGADNVTGSKDFRFKAKVPNSNYVVKVDTTATAMTSEVVENVSASTGIKKTGSSFNVAVCDGVLDLTFPAASKVKSIVISQAAAKEKLAKPYLYAIGDSTTNNLVVEKGQKSWGNCVAEGLVQIPEVLGGFSNHGKAGDDSVVYYNNARLEAVLLSICPGDYVTINMGINTREAGEAASFETMIRDYYVKGVLQRGGIPVILTATPDGPVDALVDANYDKTAGRFTNSRGNGAKNDKLRSVAEATGVKLIELGQWGQDWMNELTADDVKAYNAAYMTNYKTVLEMVQSWYSDHNHYREYLGKWIGWYVLSEISKLEGGKEAERPTLPEPQGGSIIEDFETTTDWKLTGKLAGKFSVKPDGKGGHYLVGDGTEIGAGNAYAMKAFEGLPDMETAEVSMDWIAHSKDLKTQDSSAWYALQLWSGDSELISLYVSDLRDNKPADVYYSAAGISKKEKTGVTLKQGQTLKVKFALNFAAHTLDIYLDDAKVASGVSFDALATKADTFAIATLDDTEGKKKYPNFAIDNFNLTYLNSKGPQDLSKLVKSVKPMAERDHGRVSGMTGFVHPTKATAVMGDGTELEVDINAATWSVDKTINFDELGTYTWTAGLIMPEGYSNPNNVKASYVMNYLADFLKTDINALDPIAVVTLTKAQYEAGYRHPEKVMAKLVSGKKVAIEIDQSTWTCEPVFNTAVRGIYVWTAQLKNNGTNANPRNLKVSYTMHYQADWVSTHDIEEDFLFGYPGWEAWGKDIDNTSGTGGFEFELKKDGDNPYLYATQTQGGKNRGSRMNLSSDIVKGATMEFDFMPAVVNGGSVDLLFVAPAYKQNYLSLLVNANGKVSYHTTEDLDGSGGHPKNNDFDGVISSGSPVDTGVGAIGKWMHVKLECDYLAHTASLTVTSKGNPAETYTVSGIPIDDRANGMSIMVLRKLGSCNRAEVAFDNVTVDYDRFSEKDIVKLTQFKDVNVAESQFEDFVLPTEVEATLGDKSKVMVPVGEWTSTPAFERGKPGTYVWTAKIKNEELGLTNYFDLSLSFTMTYTLLPFPVYVFNPNTLELKFGEAWSSEQLPAEVDAKMSDDSSRKVTVGKWTAIREFDAGKEGIYVYGADVIPVDGDYDIVEDKLSPNENPNRDMLDDKDKYVYDVYYRISYAKDENDNYNGYERTMENLDRGVYAVAVNGGVFVSWRLLATEYNTDQKPSFDVYRNGVKVNEKPITSKTNLVDAAGKAGDVYTVVKTQGGNTYESAQATASSQNYMSIPVQKPEPQQNKNGDLSAYTLNDMGVADVDGDGEYEVIVKWYPDNGFDSGSAVAPSSPTIFDLYEMDGTPLWRLNLGLELPSGAHFNQFMLYDLDEDGKAELFIKTSDGSISYKPNAQGKFDMDDESTIVSYIGDRNLKPGTNVNANGHVNDNSNEYVTVFNGLTGEEISTIAYVNTTGAFTDWGTTGGGGEDGGNRSARYNIAIAYLPKAEGSTETIPAVLFNRGYYDKTTVAAYTLREDGLQLEWNFVATNGTRYAGKGNHNVATGDIDKDGFDEIILGAIAIDHDGTVLWAKDGKDGQDFAAHADSIHLSAMNPDSNDLYVFTPNEEAEHSTMNAAVVNARTGARISGVWFTVKDVGRALAANITPKPGFEYWSASTGSGIYAFDGSTISNTIPVSMNWSMYWDGDLLSELGDGVATDGNWAVTKYNWENNTADTIATLEGSKTNNYTKKTPGLAADLFGDWREEVMLRNEDDTEIRIYMTTEETDYMIYTLMHDPVYRNAVANQNTSYNQPPHLGFYLGEDNKDTVLAMGLPTANIKYGTPREEKVSIAVPKDEMPEPTEEVKQKTGCSTAEELKSYLKSDVILKLRKEFNVIIPNQNTLIQEIEIKVSLDGGKTFVEATPDNFPKEGVKIVLPYPKGTNGKEYNFTVSHLITMNCNGLKAGDVVQETVNKTDQGLEIVVKSASPFAIGWYKIGSEQPAQPEQTGQPGQDEDDDGPIDVSDDKVGTPTKTGDHMGSLLWICIVLVVIAAAGIAVTLTVRYRRKK